MQDRTINNALLALRKQGGHEGSLAQVLLDMRGITWSGLVQDRPFRRSDTKRFLLHALESGPKTNPQLGKMLQREITGIANKSASNRSYQALLRLEAKGLVVRDFGPDGCLWKIASVAQMDAVRPVKTA